MGWAVTQGVNWWQCLFAIQLAFVEHMWPVLERKSHFKIHLTSQWRHNGRDGVSNHQTRDCLRNRLFRRRSKEISKFRVTGLCAGNSSVTSEFPAQKASNAENVSIWWRHHDLQIILNMAPGCPAGCVDSRLDTHVSNCLSNNMDLSSSRFLPMYLRIFRS